MSSPSSVPGAWMKDDAPVACDSAGGNVRGFRPPANSAPGPGDNRDLIQDDRNVFDEHGVGKVIKRRKRFDAAAGAGQRIWSARCCARARSRSIAWAFEVRQFARGDAGADSAG